MGYPELGKIVHLKHKGCSSSYRKGNRCSERTSDMPEITHQVLEEALEAEGIYSVFGQSPEWGEGDLSELT